MPQETIERGLLYEPPPFVAPSFWEEFNKLVPDVPNAPRGTKLLKITWGMDRLEFCAGYWERRYGDTDNTPVKYVGRARWVIEGYQPPTVFDEDEWKKDEHLLGEFPRAGIWDFVAFHETNGGGFMPLDNSALNHVRIWAHWQGTGKQRSIDELLAAKHALWAKRHKEREVAAEKVAMDFGDKVIKEFEKAVDTPKAFSMPYEVSPGGIIIPKN